MTNPLHTDSDATPPKNVLGGHLRICCQSPMTGYFRDGLCRTCDTDHGQHTVCVRVTDAFLTMSKHHGNDLTTPAPHYAFPGLKEGDKWCLCASRWLEAYHAGHAPQVILSATHERALDIIPIAYLKQYAMDQ